MRAVGVTGIDPTLPGVINRGVLHTPRPHR